MTECSFWEYVEGLTTPSFALRACCWLQYFLWLSFFSHSLVFDGDTAHQALSCSGGRLLLSTNHLTVSRQAEHTDNYWVAHWLLFWIDIILLPNFQPTSKDTHSYFPGWYSLPSPFLWQYSSLGAISTRMLQSEGMTIKTQQWPTWPCMSFQTGSPSLLCLLQSSLQVTATQACIYRVAHCISFLELSLWTSYSPSMTLVSV